MINELVVDLSRYQFAATVLYHFLFVPLTLGMTFILAIMESVYVMTNNPIYKDMTKFWGKLFAINFALGVTTGLTMEFQFGTNWAYYSHYVGDIFGAPLAIEGLMAFFLESTFVGMFFFGWDRLTKRQHLASTWLMAIGTNLSALWILVANGWMQFPVGSEFNFETMRMEMVSFADLIFNPVAQVKFVHTVAAGYTCGSMFVLGISSYYLLKKRDIPFARRSFAIAAAFGMASILSVIVLGDESGYRTGEVQKAKLAAMESQWETHPAPAPFTVFGIPDQENKTTHMAIEIPYVAGLIATRSIDEEIPGLKDQIAANETRIRRGIDAYAMLLKLQAGEKTPENIAKFNELKVDLGYGLLLSPYTAKIVDATEEQIKMAADDSIPPVAPVFFSFRIMVGAGVLMLFLIGFAFYDSCRHAIGSRTWLHKALLWGIPLPWIAIEAGWIVAEIGRQPWTIGEVLPTYMSASTLSPSDVIFSMAGICAIYTVLLVVEMYLMVKFARKGPSSLHSGKYHFEAQKQA